MNVLAFLDQLGEWPASVTARRNALTQLGRAGWRGAVAALPLLATATTAVAAPADTTADAVLLLLLLERTQLALYTQALAATGLLSGTALADVQLLRDQQQQHLDYLSQTLTNAAVTIPASPTFDFSGRHSLATNPTLFPNVLSDYSSFLALAQQLEDAGVRIYLGQLPFLTSQRLLFAAVVGMQATEARHAAHLRTLRRGLGTAVKSWPSTADAALPNRLTYQANGSSADVYTGEENDKQIVPGPVLVPFGTLLTAANSTAVQATATAEAFDEPLNTAAARAALAVFS